MVQRIREIRTIQKREGPQPHVLNITIPFVYFSVENSHLPFLLFKKKKSLLQLLHLCIIDTFRQMYTLNFSNSVEPPLSNFFSLRTGSHGRMISMQKKKWRGWGWGESLQRIRPDKTPKNQLQIHACPHFQQSEPLND